MLKLADDASVADPADEAPCAGEQLATADGIAAGCPGTQEEQDADDVVIDEGGEIMVPGVPAADGLGKRREDAEDDRECSAESHGN